MLLEQDLELIPSHSSFAPLQQQAILNVSAVEPKARCRVAGHHSLNLAVLISPRCNGQRQRQCVDIGVLATWRKHSSTNVEVEYWTFAT